MDQFGFGVGGRGRIRDRPSPRYLSDTEIQHFHQAAGCQKNVLGLQITMDNPFGMRRGQGVRRRGCNLSPFSPAEGRPLQTIAKRFPLQQFHRGEAHAAAIAEFMNRQYVGMREGCDSLGLSLKTP